MPPAVDIRRARPDECRDALAMSFAAPSLRPNEIAAQVEAFAAHARALSIDLTRQWIACEGPRRLTACTCVHSAGRLALLLLPSGLERLAGLEGAARLIQSVRDDAANAGIRLLQVLLDPVETPLLSTLLLDQHFFRLARLRYLELHAESKVHIASAPRTTASITWRPYAPDTHGLFLDVISQTYRDSRDCPALTDLRTVEDAVAGHRAAGYFRSHRWLVLMSDDVPSGCLLLNEVPMRAALEIVYMGLTPAARGSGLGYLLLSQAVELARRDGFDNLCLAVDAGNESAVRLYARAGFRAVMEKDAWLCVLRPHHES